MERLCYFAAAVMFAAVAYLLLTPPSVEPMQLRAAKEVTVEEYQRGDAPAQPSGQFVPNNYKQQQPGYLPGCDPCAGKFEQRLDEEQAVFDGTQCTRGSTYNCRVAAEGWRCRIEQDAKTWGIMR